MRALHPNQLIALQSFAFPPWCLGVGTLGAPLKCEQVTSRSQSRNLVGRRTFVSLPVLDNYLKSLAAPLVACKKTLRKLLLSRVSVAQTSAQTFPSGGFTWFAVSG